MGTGLRYSPLNYDHAEGTFDFGGKPLTNYSGKVTGKEFYVSNRSGDYGWDDANNPGTSPKKPFLTIDYAVGRCSAGRGDVIYVMPGHNEAVKTDGGLAVDVNSVRITGLGEGDARPLITVSSAVAAAAIISGTGCIVENMRFSIAIDAATDPIQISGAGCIMRYCEVIEASACEALDLISVTGARVILHDLKIRGRNTTDGDALCAIHLDGCDDCEIYNIHAYNGDWSEGVIKNEGDECLNILIHHCILQTKAPEDLCIVLDSAATGEIWEIKCILAQDADNIDECISEGDCHTFDPILVVNADSEKGIEWPGTDSADSA